MNNILKPSFIDVFSGCGGISLGLLAAGWQGLFAIEKNHDAFSTLEHNLIISNDNYKFSWPEWLPRKAMTVANLLTNHTSQLLSLQGKIDIIAGGPPCQGFSTAGKRDPKDPRNALTEEYIQIVNLVQPRALLIENVKGFNVAFKANSKSKEEKPYSLIVKDKLERLGYKVFSSLICCSNFGVPQFRKRYIMIAIKASDPMLNVLGDKDPFDYLANGAKVFLEKKGLPEGMNVTAKKAISDLEVAKHEIVPHVGGQFRYFKQIGYNEPEKLSAYQKLMRKGMNGKPLTSLRMARHTERVIERFKEIQETASLGRCLNPADRLALGIKKHSLTPLHPHLPSATVTTLPDDILHYSEPRILTVRENARLQSFPDWFEFKGKYTTGGKQRKQDCPRYTQVGNAVPPLLSEAIGAMIINLIEQASLFEEEPKTVHYTDPDPIRPGIPQPFAKVVSGPCS